MAEKSYKKALYLEYFTVVQYIRAYSPSCRISAADRLIGFGLDSGIESAPARCLSGRLTRHGRVSEEEGAG